MSLRRICASAAVIFSLSLAGCSQTSTPGPDGHEAPATSTPITIKRPSPGTTILDFTGIGDLKLNASSADLQAAKLIQPSEGECGEWAPTDRLNDLGVRIIIENDRVKAVMVTTDDIPTAEGARVGMNFGDMKTVYADQFTLVTKSGPNGEVKVGVVRNGDNELVFLAGGEIEPTDESMVTTIHARATSDDLLSQC